MMKILEIKKNKKVAANYRFIWIEKFENEEKIGIFKIVRGKENFVKKIGEKIKNQLKLLPIRLEKKLDIDWKIAQFLNIYNYIQTSENTKYSINFLMKC